MSRDSDPQIEAHPSPGPTGRFVPIAGVDGATQAFVPNPLPPAWEWPSEMWPLLIEAKTALAHLDGVAKHLPNPQILLFPLQNREAQKSSTIEGTITEPEQQLLFQLEPEAPKSEGDPANAYLEVLNYFRALRFAQEARNSLPLSLRLIRDLHRILFDGVQRAKGEPGEFRRTQNAIGSPIRYVPPPLNELPECLASLERYLHQEKKFDPLIEAFLVHYQFEAIQPFRDGNGRVGRLLLAMLILEWSGLSNHWLYMSAYFDANHDRYVDGLLRVSTHGDWAGWVDFCLRGVIDQASDTERRCEKLLEASRSFEDKVTKSGGSARLQGIIDDLLVLPAARIAQVAKKYSVRYPTARSDLEKLVDLGILTEVPNVKPRTFYAQDIMRATFGDLPK